ncbi:MAG: hypothetical protein WD872_05590 [Pirellulaceae bacterium]
MRARFHYLLAFSFVALSGVLLAQPGDDPSEPKTSETKSARPSAKLKNRQPLAITPEREAAVFAFVERNHAELTDLLTHLKTNQPKQYVQAVKDIYRVTDRLAQLQERDPLHYELEIELWTAQSHVQLLTARLRMGDSDEYRQQLRAAVGEQIEARLAVLKHQHGQAAQRLAKMEREIGELEENRETVIDKQVAGLTRAARGKGGAKNAGKTTNKQNSSKRAKVKSVD